MKSKLTIIFTCLFFFAFSQPTLDWAVHIGGSSYEYGTSLDTDSQGNIYATGQFRGTVDFDPGNGQFNLTSVGNEDIYVVKLTSTGQFLWAVQLGGFGQSTTSDDDNSFDINVDDNGNVTVVGQFGGTCDFDPGPNTLNVTSNGMCDVFILKLNSQGSFIWVKTVGGSNKDIAKSVDVNTLGEIIITGEYFGSVDFDPGSGSFIMNGSGPYSNGSTTTSTEIFLLKLDSNGDFIWAIRTGDYSYDRAWSKFDSQGNILNVGNFGGTADFDPGPAVYNLTANNGYYSPFFRKLDSNGNLLWAHAINSTQTNMEAYSLTIDQSDNLIAGGYFKGTAYFDPGSNLYNLTSAGAMDGFTIKYDSAGNFQWATQVGGSVSDAVVSVSTDQNNNVYSYGYINSDGNTADFDPGPQTYYLPGNTVYGTFLQTLDSSSNLLWAIRAQEAPGANNVTSNEGFGLHNSGSSIYFTGDFNNSPDFDPSVNTFNLTTNGGRDAFIQKLNGCFTVKPAMNLSACDSLILPSGLKVFQSGTYYDTLNTGYCDTAYEIHLSLSNSSFSSLSVVSCDSFVSPSGQIKYNGGTFNDTLQNSSGCDSIITISLVINFSSTSTSTIDVCDQFILPSGKIAQTSGLVFDTIQNTSGCDSIIAFDLLIRQSNSSTQSVSACDSFISPDGIKYFNSGIITSVITNIDGCDSTITTDLDVIKIDSIISFVAGVLSVPSTSTNYQWYNCITNSPIQGANSASYTPIINGLFSVLISNGICEKMSSCFNVDFTGIDEHSPQIFMHPNPVKDILSISSSETFHKLQLFDFSGKLLLSFLNPSSQIDLTSISKGLYLIRVSSQNGDTSTYIIQKE